MNHSKDDTGSGKPVSLTTVTVYKNYLNNSYKIKLEY